MLLLALPVWGAWALNRAARRTNKTDWGGLWLNWMDGLNRLFCYRYHRLNVTGLRLPASGPAIVVSNHVSGLDAMLLIASARRPLRFLIAREEYERFGVTWLLRACGCIPVDRQRKPEQALRAALRALKQGEVVALFPHGKIHLDSDPPRKLKAGAARLAQLTGSRLYPARITGVAGAGHVVRGLLLRGHARIRLYPPVESENRDSNELLDQLAAILDGRISPNESTDEPGTASNSRHSGL